MLVFNAGNERIKHRYFTFLAEAKRLSPSSIDQVAAALKSFEESTRHRDFKSFRIEQAESYKRRLREHTQAKNSEKLAKATITGRLASLKAFFQWLAIQPGYKSKINYTDAEYFNASAVEGRIAKAHLERRAPTVAEIRKTVLAMPCSSDVEKRDRAVMAFAIVSGARDSAIATLKLKHVDVVRRRIVQNPKDGVRTKNSKTITSAFFPVDQELEDVVDGWISFLRSKKGYADEDPLFPATKIDVGASGTFEQTGLSRDLWKSATAIRRIFKNAFAAANLPYFNPHSFRSTLAILGTQICKTPEEFKAWSQNLSHESVMTTFNSYGNVAQSRQDEILLQLATDVKDSAPQHADLLVVENRLERIEQMLSGIARR